MGSNEKGQSVGERMGEGRRAGKSVDSGEGASDDAVESGVMSEWGAKSQRPHHSGLQRRMRAQGGPQRGGGNVEEMWGDGRRWEDQGAETLCARTRRWAGGGARGV